MKLELIECEVSKLDLLALSEFFCACEVHGSRSAKSEAVLLLSMGGESFLMILDGYFST